MCCVMIWAAVGSCCSSLPSIC